MDVCSFPHALLWPMDRQQVIELQGCMGHRAHCGFTQCSPRAGLFEASLCLTSHIPLAGWRLSCRAAHHYWPITQEQADGRRPRVWLEHKNDAPTHPNRHQRRTLSRGLMPTWPQRTNLGPGRHPWRERPGAERASRRRSSWFKLSDIHHHACRPRPFKA